MLTSEESQELGLKNELEECRAASIHFINIPIPDRSVPADRKNFLKHLDELVEQVSIGKFLAVHCRAGVGRSSLLVVSLLVRLGWM